MGSGGAGVVRLHVSGAGPVEAGHTMLASRPGKGYGVGGDVCFAVEPAKNSWSTTKW